MKPNVECSLIFKPMVGFEGKYSISSRGDIRSDKTGKIRKTFRNGWGYLSCVLYDNNRDLKNVRVHCAVMAAFVGPLPPKMEIDHINRIRTDNRLSNLRYCSVSCGRQNMAIRKRNASGFRGVYKHSQCKTTPWRAKAQIGYKQKWSVYFATEKEAACAYDKMVIEAHGENALTNKQLGLI
jgi:hypothetical protein